MFINMQFELSRFFVSISPTPSRAYLSKHNRQIRREHGPLNYVIPYAVPPSISLHRIVRHLLVGDLDLSGLNIIGHSLRAATVHLAACAESSSENLLDRALQILRHGLKSHSARNVDDLIERDALRVFDVLLLLAVSWGLFEGLDDERRGGGDDGDGSLTVLDGEFDRNPKALPVAGGLGNIFTVQPGISFRILSYSRSQTYPTFFGDRPSGPIYSLRIHLANIPKRNICTPETCLRSQRRGGTNFTTLKRR